MKDFLIGKVEASTLPKINKNNPDSDVSSSKDSDDSSQLLLYVLPLLILGVAFLLRYYYNKE